MPLGAKPEVKHRKDAPSKEFRDQFITTHPAKIHSAALVGIKAQPIEVEVDASAGLSSFTIVGLGDKAVKESKERIASAIKHAGASPPNRQNRRVTVNLAPADVPKGGSAYDLAIAVGYLIASEQMRLSGARSFGKGARRKIMLVGELALDGSLRPVRGALAIAKAAARHGFAELLVPQENALEAAIIDGIRVIPLAFLRDAVNHLEGTSPIEPQKKTSAPLLEDILSFPLSITDIHGHEHAKRALEISAAGGHNVLLFGTPGTGKTMLAKSLPSILPHMTETEAIEVTEIFSASGIPYAPDSSPQGPLVTRRPFRAPHHTASAAAIIGGGTDPHPGEVSLAHRGVLFLDELPEFRRDVLEALRQPLEDGVVTVSRSKQTVVLPARFTLVASMNPCPCGYYGDEKKECSCSPGEIERYRKRLSGPLLDRIDMQVFVPRLPSEKIIDAPSTESTQELALIRERVLNARKRQHERLAPLKKVANAELSSKEVKSYVHLEKAATEFLKKTLDAQMLSVRSYYRMIKVAQTIADLDGADRVTQAHVAEVIQYRVRE